MRTQCNAIGSPSGVRLYQSRDGSKSGVVLGVRAGDGSIVYGVADLSGGFDWIVTCKYDDIFPEGDGFAGRVRGGTELTLD